jgi:SrtB family sortase
MKKKAKIISSAVACAAAIGLGAYVFALNSKDGEVPTFSEITPVQTKQAETEAPLEFPVYDDYVDSNAGLTERAKMLLRMNKDIIGWITIPETEVDYPVVLDPGEIWEDTPGYDGEHHWANWYYLDHDLDGSYKREGTLFMDWRDVFGSSEDEQSENLVIYGHNMANNTMFGSLRRYRQDYGYYEGNEFITLSSNYRDYDYVIFGYRIASGNWYTDFVYWDMEELDSEDDFNYYYSNIMNYSMINPGLDVKYGDKLLTLSTCYSDEDNSRFIIVARRLRPGEVAGDMSTIERTEEYKQAHAEEPTDTEAAPAE